MFAFEIVLNNRIILILGLVKMTAIVLGWFYTLRIRCRTPTCWAAHIGLIVFINALITYRLVNSITLTGDPILISVIESIVLFLVFGFHAMRLRRERANIDLGQLDFFEHEYCYLAILMTQVMLISTWLICFNME